MEFRILGPLEILDDSGHSVGLRGSRERAVLTLMLLSANQVVSADRLADDLWGDRPPEGADHALQVHVSRLRQALRAAGGEGMIVTQTPGYLVRVDPAAIDAARFETLVGDGRERSARGDHDGAAATLREALGLWRGPALADVAEAPVARAEAARLEEARLAAMEERVEADLACGRHGALVAELDALTRAHPLRERFWAQRMIALYRAGRQVEALRAYQDLRVTLGEELGLEPGSSLRRLESAILRHDAALDWRPPSGDAGPTGGDLPETPSPALPMPDLLTETSWVFVGRDPPLKQLGALWMAAAGGERRLALLSGEPGVGKTRLAAEFAGRLHLEGATVMAGRCDEDLGVPYQPFVEAFRHFAEHTFAERLAPRLGRHPGELVRLHPDLAGRFSDLAPPLRSDPQTERYRLFDAVAGWLAAASSHGPVLLVLDDLQWATKPTLLLLRHVMRSPEPMHLLIVGAYRDTELAHDHPLVEVLADFRRQAGVERLALSGLAPGEVARFMAEAAGHEMDDDGLALARTIHNETQGNPFFLREVIRHLAETGGIEQRDGRWGTRLPVDEVAVPEGVREVIGRRLARLSGEANRVLRVAAVAGTDFELAVIREASDLDEETILTALEEAISARLIAEVPGPVPRYRFTHALVRSTLYGNLSGARRVTIHRRVAEAIEVVHDVLEDHLPALAYHWARAAAPVAETGRAVDYATRAGHRALAQLAHDDAARHYASALEILASAGAHSDDRRRLELLISLGEAQRRASDPGYRQTLLDAARLARRLGDADALARAALANTLGHVWTGVMLVDADRVETLEAALTAVGEDDLRLRARLLATLGLELAWQDDPDRRLGLAEEGLRIARSLDDPETLAPILLARDYTIHAPDNVAERLSATAELLDVAERLGDPVLESRALSLRFKAAMELADVTEAQRCLARNQALVVDLGQPALTWATMHHRATLSVLRGDPDTEVTINAAQELGATARPDIGILAWSQRFSLYLEQGRMAELEEFAVQVARRVDYPLTRSALAFLLVESGRPDAATTLFDELASSGFAHPTNNVGWLLFAAQCAWICARLGRSDCVPLLRSRLEPYADQLVVASFAGWVLGSVSLHLALLHRTAGDLEAAEAHFAAATALHERIGARPWLARTRLEQARLLLARAAPEDGARADDLLRRALTTARELGLPQLEREARALRP
jgi:DNA-binding SARP family transcriptional activator